MFRFILACLILVFPVCCFCQTRPAQFGQNLLNLSYTSQYYLNKTYVENGVRGTISAENTFGYKIGLEYQRITRHGLTFSAGWLYGKQNHRFNVSRDFTDFDPSHPKSLNGFTTREMFNITIPYIEQRYMVGYVWPLSKTKPNSWAIDARIGVAAKMPVKESQYNRQYIIRYTSDDGMTDYIRGAGAINYVFGSERVSANTLIYFMTSYAFHLGFTKTLNKSILKNISVAVEYATTTIPNPSIEKNASDFVQVFSQNSVQETTGIDYYYNKDRSFGIQIALGLWH